MALFWTRQEFKALFDELFEELSRDPVAGPKLRAARTVQRYQFHDLGLTIDVGPADEKKAKRGGNLVWTWDAAGKRGAAPDVTLRLTSVVAHRYFIGKENIPLAVARGTIVVVEGDLKLVLDLIPIVVPFQKQWVARLAATGRRNLLA